MPKRPPSYVLIIGIIVAIVLLAGLNRLMTPPSPEDEEAEADRQAQKITQKIAQKPSLPAPQPEKAAAENKMVILDTDKGQIKIRLFYADMPVTTANFTNLVEQKFYDGLVFHRVEDWVVQGGDPRGNGTGGSGKQIKLEINKKTHWIKEGQVGMARSSEPDSASSQFFITTKPAAWLNPSPRTGEGYALFGEVVEGMDVVKKRQRGDKIKSASLADSSAKSGEQPQPKPGGAPTPPPPKK